MTAPSLWPPRHARTLTVLVLVALVLAQTLGWLHRSRHGAWADAGVAHLSAPAHDPARATKGSWLAELFAHDAGSSDCRLYDVLAQPGCVAAPLVLLAHTVAMDRPLVGRWGIVPHGFVPFDARGPPAFH